MVELIHVQPKVPSIFLLNLLSSDGDLMEFGNEQTTQEIGVLLANRAVGEACQKDLAAVHDIGEVEPVFPLGDDVPEGLGTEKGVEARQHRPLGSACPEEAILLPVIDNVQIAH